MLKKIVDFLLMLSNFYPDMFRQMVTIFRWSQVTALQATQAMLCVWGYMDYDLSRVARATFSIYAQTQSIDCVAYKAGTYDPLKMVTICRNMSG
jgi:hypothetical protein